MTTFSGDVVMEEGSKFLPFFSYDILFSSVAISILA